MTTKMREKRKARRSVVEVERKVEPLVAAPRKAQARFPLSRLNSGNANAAVR
jgi:hypothetical protein